MAATRQRHFEPFVHLVDVTDTAALVAWGGFWLDRDAEGGCKVVDDEALDDPQRRQGGTIGVQSPSYGPAVVEVLDAGGNVVGRASARDRNSAWVEGLEPDTEYRYRVVVDGRLWAEGPRWDWAPGASAGEERRRPQPRRYDMRLRTHTREDSEIPVTFVAVGDYGVGIANGEAGCRQQQVARTLESLAATRPVRLVVALGDNIYHAPEGKEKGTGDEDDDWYFTFYEPYRYLIDHLPFYPTVGNHDGPDSESSDDRAQLADNFHLEERFHRRAEQGRASLGPGLFYRVQIGALLQLVCVDTTWGAHVGSHYFEDDDHRRWLEDALPPRDGPRPDRMWRIPFCHHPPYSAGPDHRNMTEQIDRLLPLYRRAGVPLVLSGHEHNFQHGRVDGFDYVVAGAGGKLDPDVPERWEEAGTVAWAQEPHCLLVEVEPDRVVVTPYGVPHEGAEPQPLRCLSPAGEPVDGQVVVRRPS